VLTIGRGSQRGLPREAAPSHPPGVEVVEVSRGGGLTYHGPGQLVGYPIVPVHDRDVRGFLRRLEAALVDGIASFGVTAKARDGLTGVWVESAAGERKVASIGVAFRQWVSYHGFSVNVTTDLSVFRDLSPCGLDGSVMTSLDRELGRRIDRDEVCQALWPRIERALGL